MKAIASVIGERGCMRKFGISEFSSNSTDFYNRNVILRGCMGIFEAIINFRHFGAIIHCVTGCAAQYVRRYTVDETGN